MKVLLLEPITSLGRGAETGRWGRQQPTHRRTYPIRRVRAEVTGTESPGVSDGHPETLDALQGAVQKAVEARGWDWALG